MVTASSNALYHLVLEIEDPAGNSINNQDMQTDSLASVIERLRRVADILEKENK